MQVTVTYSLTERAQLAAMAATNQPVAIQQILAGEIPASDLDLFRVSVEGQASLDLSVSNWSRPNTINLVKAGWEKYGDHANAPSMKTIPEIIADLRRGAELLAREAAELAAVEHANGEHNRRLAEEAYQRLLADPGARIESLHGSTVAGQRSPADFWARDHAALKAEIERRDQAHLAAKQAAEAAERAGKEQFIAEWVQAHGDEPLRAQFADRLTCRNTILAMIADAAFEAAGVPAKHESKQCDNRECPCGSSSVDCLPAEIYAAWRKFPARLPETTSTKFLEVRDCLRDEDGLYEGEGESAGDPYYVVHILMRHGPFQFGRTVRLKG